LISFEKTVASGADESDIIEKIDIGGISCCCCKKLQGYCYIASVDEYSLLLDLITDQDGATTLADRKLINKSFSCFISL
jgi:phosphoribosylaminoimidazolecarboxamide formyltransferase/IMP cyclohydrolase